MKEHFPTPNENSSIDDNNRAYFLMDSRLNHTILTAAKLFLLESFQWYFQTDINTEDGVNSLMAKDRKSGSFLISKKLTFCSVPMLEYFQSDYLEDPNNANSRNSGKSGISVI